MAKNEAKIRFSAETKEMDAQIKKSGEEYSKLRAELKLNETQMKSTGASVEALEDKHKILSAQLEQSESKTQALSQKLEKAKAIFGENSTEANRLETQLLNAQTAEEKLRQAVAKCSEELEGQKAAAAQAESATEKLADTIEKQQTTLSQLKADYANAVLSQGKFSKEARELAKQIDTLSSELKENQTTMERVEGAADKLDNTLDNMDETAEKVAEGFTVMKGAMADLAADGIEAVVSGLGEIATEAFTMSNDIDKATNTFIAKTGASAAEAAEFEAAMTDIYNGNYGESFEDIAESMSTVKTAMGDIGTDALKKVTTDALVLRDTFDMDVNESVRAVNSMMDQFGITSDEAFNLLAQGAQNGLNQNGDLLDVINEYSVQFQNAGYSADDMFNMLANGVDAGTWSVDKLGDAVKEFNIRMSDGSAKDAVEALGFSWEEVSAAWSKGGDEAKEVFNMLFNELDGMENTTSGYAIGVGLLGTMYEDIGQDAVLALSKTKGEISSTKDAMAEINSVKYDDLGSALEGIGRNLQTSLAEPIKNDVMPAVNEFIQDVDWQGVGQTIGSAFGAVVEGAFAVANAIKDATQWMQEHKGVVIAVAAVIGTLTAAIGLYNAVNAIKAAMDAAQVTTVWGLVAAHIAQAAAAMAAIAPYVLIVAAIAAVIAIIVLLVKNWDTVVEAVKKCWEKVKETLAQWGEWINTNVIQPVVNFFKGLWDSITSACSSAWEWVKGVFSSFVNWIGENIITPIVNFFTGLWDSIKTIWNGICNAIQFAIMLIGSIISAAFQIITLPFRFIWENCKEYVFAAWEWIKDKVKTAINAVKTTITNVWNAIKTATSKVWDAIKSAISKAAEAVKTTVTNIWNAIKNATSTAWNAVKTVVSNIWNNIKSAVTSAINAVKSTVSNVWNSVKSTTSNIWNGIKSAISNVWNGIKSGVSTAVNAVKSTVSNVFNTIKSTATSVWNNIKSAITKPIDAAKQHIRNALDAIKGFFSGLKLKLPDIKLPHFSLTGSFSLNPPSVPKLSVSWYKDAMNNPTILNNATIFGYSNGRFLGGGEAGSEMIGGTRTIMDMIQNAVDRSVGSFNIGALADAIEDLASRPIELAINGRQFAVATASDGDSVNGLRSTFKTRGLIMD